MPIIVNNFEIILSGETGPQDRSARPGGPLPASTPPAREAAPAQAQAPAAPPALRPEDLELIMRRFAQRRARLRAD